MNNKIELHEKKMCSKTLCGDCFWLDKVSQQKTASIFGVRELAHIKIQTLILHVAIGM